MELDSSRLRAFAALKYYDPANVLREHRKLENEPALRALPQNVRQLRTHKYRRWREGRVGALFAFGMGQCLLKTPVFIALAENEDYDFVTRWQQGDQDCFCAVQEKELPPAHLNATVTLDAILRRLANSRVRSDTAALVYLNREGLIDLSSVVVPRTLFAELWFMGAMSPDQNKWYLFGNALDCPGLFHFNYPT